MLATGITPDFIVVDGAEGGTGAAPLEFTDHVGVPLQEGLLLVHNTLVGHRPARSHPASARSGKIITAFDIARMLAHRRRLVQRGARLHVRARLHPGADLPHRTLPDRRHHAGSAAPAGAGRARQGRARAQLPPQHAARAQEICSGRGADASGANCAAHHIVHRVSPTEVKLLSMLLPVNLPGDLLRDAPGRLRHAVFEKWWDRAVPDAFALPDASTRAQ